MSGANVGNPAGAIAAVGGLSSRSQASAAIEAAHAKLVKMLPEGVLPAQLTAAQQKYDSKPLYRQWLDPELPPLLAPIPQFCRLIAFAIIAPIIIACLTDFAGYAIFRTLGFRRRRVRVKEVREKAGIKSLPPPLTASILAASNNGAPESPSLQVRAPLLTPGAYDADTLLRHRARSISGESAEAEEEWIRTGGKFARVSTVRASQEAAAAKESSATQSSMNLSPLPKFNYRHELARANDVGVDGALGYSDTDADDSGAESGRNSPEIQRKPWRRGLTSSSLGFTPVSPSPRDGGSEQMGLGMYNDPNLATSSDAQIEASKAADLEPISSAKLQALQP
ncbi:uncharacterized protein FA14DRAFT_181685 [Meira miltonrushii]|uniref:Uncharacterized protein n=1 Tax=Meira miltonrushii TaxID=1280837 RepID=A0A316V976_9BASI|nr:uncharacterized protein FA14DRAFT_181685 [Meira miltonrushii]PWN33021.1 hypothetical protein FA14DRAFT_181685 [Meira miltonrushii]